MLFICFITLVLGLFDLLYYSAGWFVKVSLDPFCHGLKSQLSHNWNFKKLTFFSFLINLGPMLGSAFNITNLPPNKQKKKKKINNF